MFKARGLEGGLRVLYNNTIYLFTMTKINNKKQISPEKKEKILRMVKEKAEKYYQESLEDDQMNEIENKIDNL